MSSLPSRFLMLLGWIGTIILVVLITTPFTNAFQSLPSSTTTRFPSVAYSDRAVLLHPKESSSLGFSTSSIISSSSFRSNTRRKVGTVLQSSGNDDENNENTSSSGDQLLLGGLGTFASLVTFYSEYTLFTTGCGLPAGPFGLVGLVEGLSYLGMLGIVSYSVVTKIRTGSGLPAGPFGLLGAAEGLSFLAILLGLVVLVAQLTNYGYIPNAIPMEGGMCS